MKFPVLNEILDFTGLMLAIEKTIGKKLRLRPIWWTPFTVQTYKLLR